MLVCTNATQHGTSRRNRTLIDASGPYNIGHNIADVERDPNDNRRRDTERGERESVRDSEENKKVKKYVALCETDFELWLLKEDGTFNVPLSEEENQLKWDYRNDPGFMNQITRDDPTWSGDMSPGAARLLYYMSDLVDIFGIEWISQLPDESKKTVAQIFKLSNEQAIAYKKLLCSAIEAKLRSEGESFGVATAAESGSLLRELPPSSESELPQMREELRNNPRARNFPSPPETLEGDPNISGIPSETRVREAMREQDSRTVEESRLLGR